MESGSEGPFIGRRIRRREDLPLITGRGRYTDDLRLEGEASLVVVRSEHPAAILRRIDLEAARSMPGVLGVWQAVDLPEVSRPMPDMAVEGVAARHRPVLAAGVVRYVGEPIAVVVAEDLYRAQDAAAAVVADMEPRAAVAGIDAALAEHAPLVHHDLPSNRAGTLHRGFGDIEAAFSGAPIVVRRRLRMARVAGAAMEPRAAVASWTEETGYTIWSSTQWVFGVKDAVVEVLGLAPDAVRVRALDVGGGFGAKGIPYPEEVLVALAARRVRRPVRWAATRGEDLGSTIQAHGCALELELASESDGRLRGLRGRIILDIGGYATRAGNRTDTIVPHLICMYHLPALDVDVDLVYTNAVPTGFIRGGGRPIGNFGIERMMDELAARLRIDPADLRRRNLITPHEMPYDTRLPQGSRTAIYDGGDFPVLLDTALREARRDDRGRRREPGVGVGLACCVESTGIGSPEPVRVVISPLGDVQLSIGATPQGQGHLTMAAQVIADRLGWPIEHIDVRAGDTEVVPYSQVTAASRSALEVGNAVALVGQAARRELLDRASTRLEAALEDLVLTPEGAIVKGSPDRAVPIQELVPTEGLEVRAQYASDQRAYSSSCHVATVKVDPEAGAVEILSYVIVGDVGKPINPTQVEGQIHGGWAHGLGYALFEESTYEPDGTYLTGTFLDYTIVAATETSVAPEIHHVVATSDHNPEGFKGAGEAGTIPAPAVIASAVDDALRSLGFAARVDRIPITPVRIFESLQTADRVGPSDPGC